MAKVNDDFEQYLEKYLQNSSKLAILLDYDGTLTPIVSHPDLAVIPSEAKNVLQALSQIPELFVAIISGRGVNNVKQLVGIDSITYAGNHGLEVIYPDGSKYDHQLPSNFEDQVKELVNQLQAKLVRDGAWIEDKGASLTFHFRGTPLNVREDLEKEAIKIVEAANFKASKAHMAVEARPKVDWNKGSVALMLLEKKYGKNWNKETKVIFVGDDTTDEDAMKALKGNAALFRIANSATVSTHADKIISSTEDTLKILKIVQKLFKLQ